MPAVHTASARPFPWRWAILAVTLAGLVLGLLGPFGSYLNGGWVTRIAYWVASMWLGILTFGAGYWCARKLAPQGTDWAWPMLALATLAASLPHALITRAVAFELWPELMAHGLTLWRWYLQVAMIGLASVLGGTLLLHSHPTHAELLIGEPPAANLIGPIVALQMEDHYVRFHTATGSNLVLMTLGQAMEQVRGIEGLRTHRSWWVARNAVTAVEGSPRSMSLRLSNGMVAPVARNAVARLRAAGWLEP